MILNLKNPPKYLRLCSDLHLDFDVQKFRSTRAYNKHEPNKSLFDFLYTSEPLSTDKETALLVVGDIWSDGKFYQTFDENEECWLHSLSRQFQYVFLVLGNHDYWGCKLDKEPEKAKEFLNNLENNLPNVYLFENDVIAFDEVKFVGATLWTDYGKKNPICLASAKDYLNDYQYMTKQDGNIFRKVRSEDLYEKFLESKEFIFDNAIKDNENQKLIVLTHMAPSAMSVHERYKNHGDYFMNMLYHSELGNEISYTDINLWCHGHTHDKFDYMIHNTRILCNPRGYEGHENTGFDPVLLLEIKNL